ncbi:MAG: hypothetical protein R3D58_18720 [Saprospiraceae bacterium]
MLNPLASIVTLFTDSLLTDSAKWLVGKLTDNPEFKKFKARHGLLESNNDFFDRYAEAYVALFQEDKPRVLKAFFNEISVAQAIEDFHWTRVGQPEFERRITEIGRHLTVDDQLAGTGLQLHTELAVFLRHLNLSVHMSRSAAQAEDHGLLEKIDATVSDLKTQQADTNAVWRDKYPNTNPYPKPRFFRDSRADDLAAVREQLQGDRCLVLVNGTGGIGKTSVAAAFCADHAADFNCIVWMHCENRVREAFLRSPLYSRLFAPGAFAPGTPEDTIFEAMLARFASAPEGPKLLVLDNANDGDELVLHERRLRNLAGWAVLVTSRAEDTGLPYRRIGTLPPERAHTLFCDHFPPAAAQPELLERLLAAIGYHTLLVECLAKHLANRLAKGKNADVQALCDSLSQDGVLELPKSGAVKVGWQNHPPAAPDALLDALFTLEKLDAPAQQLLQQLALLPAEPQPLTLLYTLFSLEDETEASAIFDARLEALARSGWLEFYPGEGYRLHPVPGAVVRRRLLPDFESCGGLVQQLRSMLADQTIHLERRLELCDAAHSVAGYLAGEAQSPVASLHVHLADTEYDSGNFSDTERLLQEAAWIYEAAGDFKGQSWVFERLGRYHQTCGDFDAALEFFEKYRALQEQFYEVEPDDEWVKNNLAISYEKLGNLWQKRGDFDRALDYFEKRSQLGEELYASNPRNESLKHGLAISYGKLGELWQKRGDFDRALDYFEKWSQLGEALYASTPRNESLKNGLAISYEKLGALWQDKGDFDRALDYFEKDAKLTEELYATNPRNESLKNNLAISYEKLGDVYLKTNDFKQAETYYSKCHELCKALCAANPQNITLIDELAVSNFKLGALYTAMGKPAQARPFFEKCQAHCTELWRITQLPKYKEWLDSVAARLG